MPRPISFKLLYLLLGLAAVLIACQTAPSAENQAPTASFTVTEESGARSFSFDAGGSSDPDGEVASYAWDFGDGETATGETATASHSYAEPGEYTVTLTVTDDDDAKASSSEQVEANYTSGEVEQEFGDLSDDTSTLVTAGFQSEGAVALSLMPPFPAMGGFSLDMLMADLLEPRSAAKLLAPQAHSDSDLPRGTYEYDAATGDWVPVAGGDTLVLRWSYENFEPSTTHQAELAVDWDVASATEVVDDGFGSMIEVPTDMSASLSVDGDEVAAFALAADWYESDTCGPILEPSSLSLSGYVGDDSARLELDLGFSIGDDTISTQGQVIASAGADSATFDWDLSMNGAVTRDGNCFLANFDLESGSLAFGISATVAGETDSLEFAVDFSNIVMDEFGAVTSVELSNGVITLNGLAAVTFEGTLNDQNGNGVPGENVTLSFADGTTMTLEAFLLSSGGLPAPLVSPLSLLF